MTRFCTCRFCKKSGFTSENRFVKYAVRHYAHADCFLDAGHELTELSGWQISQIPYRILADRELFNLAERLVKQEHVAKPKNYRGKTF